MVYRNYSLPLQYVHFVSHMCRVLFSIQDAKKMKTCLWNHMVQTTKGYVKLLQLCFLFWFFCLWAGQQDANTAFTYLLKFFLIWWEWLIYTSSIHIMALAYIFLYYLCFCPPPTAWLLAAKCLCLLKLSQNNKITDQKTKTKDARKDAETLQVIIHIDWPWVCYKKQTWLILH